MNLVDQPQIIFTKNSLFSIIVWGKDALNQIFLMWTGIALSLNIQKLFSASFKIVPNSKDSRLNNWAYMALRWLRLENLVEIKN